MIDEKKKDRTCHDCEYGKTQDNAQPQEALLWQEVLKKMQLLQAVRYWDSVCKNELHK